MKGPVILRQRTLPSGNTKLYLDIYIDGERHSESLGMFLVPEKDRADKERNRETLRMAETVAAQRLLDIRNRRFGFASAGDVLLYPLFDKWLDKAVKKKTRRYNAYLLLFIRRYDGNEMLRMKDIDKTWCRGFADSLARGLQGGDLAPNTQRSLWEKLRAFIHFAMECEVIPADPSKGLRPFKREKTPDIKYLTIDELRQLSATPDRDDVTRRMFLFSCFTGLRLSDVEQLTWDEITSDMSRIIFRQRKTGGLEYLDLNSQAVELMGKRGSGPVFEPINRSRVSISLTRWVKNSGIGKHITFHCARHTFATMMLSLGTDIYTVSKLLGHSDVSITQVYAKVIDEKKRAAVDRIPKIL